MTIEVVALIRRERGSTRKINNSIWGAVLRATLHLMKGGGVAMRAAQNPLEVPLAQVPELLAKFVATLPTWATGAGVVILATFVGIAWAIAQMVQAFNDRQLVKRASTTREGALEALRIIHGARRRSFFQLPAGQAGDRQSPSSPAEQ